MTPTAEDVRRHESAHASMARLLGVEVLLVDVTGDATALGRCHHALQVRTPADAIRRLLIVLAPMVEAGTGVPGWPPRRDGSTDERSIAALVEALGLGEDDYLELVSATGDLVLSREFQTLALRIEGLLAHCPRLTAPTIAALEAMEA